MLLVSDSSVMLDGVVLMIVWFRFLLLIMWCVCVLLGFSMWWLKCISSYYMSVIIVSMIVMY